MKNVEEMGDQQKRQYHRSDEPGGNALDDPVNFPGPALDSTKWNEIAGRSEATDPVIENANKRVRTHIHLGSSDAHREILIY